MSRLNCDTIPAVYPRVCGGTAFARMGPQNWTGLSPRVRGNPCLPTMPPPRMGSIPACAGEPSVVPIDSEILRVYPRVCGGTRRRQLHLRPR